MSIRSIFWGFVFGTVLLSACSQSPSQQQAKMGSEKELPVIERKPFQESPLESIYGKIRPATQTYSIQPNETQTLRSSNGMEVLIPAHSFIDASGNLVVEDVEIEIIEVAELTDFISCNLQTLSNNKVLESAGMLFIDAKSKGQAVTIAEGQKISISMPMMTAESGFQMFTGERDENGALNWIVDPSAEKEYLIPFSADFLYREYQKRTNYYTGFWNAPFDPVEFDPKNEKYANTLIQTREFRDRYDKLHSASVVISALLNKNVAYGSWNSIRLDEQLFQLYFSNPYSDIEKLDAQATEIVHSFMDSPEFKDWLNSEKEDNSFGSRYFAGYNEKAWKEWYDFGSDYAKGNVPQLKDYGVDLSQPGAYNDLMAKGATQDEALLMLNLEKDRNQYFEELKALEEAEEAMAKQVQTKTFVRQTVFTTSQLGWINCDRFLNDSNAGKANIIVSIESDNSLSYVDCSLVIPDLNVKLGAYTMENGQYTFTKKEGVYTKLPIGKDAFIVGVSLVDGQTLFSSQKIRIEDGIAVVLKMKPIATSDLKKAIEQVLAPKS